MHFLLDGPTEPSTTPTLVAELSVVNTEALAMPRNAAPPSSLAALGEEGCRNSAWQDDAVTSTLPPFGVAADSNAEPCPAASHPVLAVDDQRPEGSQFSRRAARSEWNHPQDDVAATELASDVRVEARISFQEFSIAGMRMGMTPPTVPAVHARG